MRSTDPRTVLGLGVIHALLCAGLLHAGQGVAELALDRAAVTELLAAATPERLVVSAPAIGEIGVRVKPPTRVFFRDGAVEATFPLEIDALAWRVPLVVRYLPAVERRQGTVRLLPASAELPAWSRLSLDATRWMPPVDLPRRLDWSIDLEPGGQLEVRCFLHGVKIEEERLVVELGLHVASRP